MTESTKKGGRQQVPITQKGGGVKKAEPGHTAGPVEEIEHMFDDFFAHRWMRPFDFGHPFWRDLPTPFTGRMAPRVDIINRDNEIVLRAQVPGVDKKDIDVSMSDNTVTIKGHTSHEKKEEKGDYYRRECSSGSFSRTFTLPGEVDGTRAKATFNDGVLEL
ncbi:MAG: Hsp20/alpha crystallin family protein, partial [Mariprofundaceae bacterium]|nr:Hsp20/alpha crystallin family protein [Mariprofundaceae bacterium]